MRMQSPASSGRSSSASSRASTPDEAVTSGQKRKRGGKSSKGNGRSNGSKTRELLSQEQKSANHRRAEQSRRNECLVRLTTICDELIPGAAGLAKSTEVAFLKTHEHLRQMLLEKKELIEQIQALGGEVPSKEMEAIAALDAYDAISSDEEYTPKNSEERQFRDEDESGDSDDGDNENDGSEEQEEDAVTAAESLSHMKNGH